MLGAIRTCLLRCCPRCRTRELPSTSPSGSPPTPPARPRRRSPRFSAAGLSHCRHPQAVVPIPNPLPGPADADADGRPTRPRRGETAVLQDLAPEGQRSGAKWAENPPLSAATLERLQAAAKADPRVRFGLHAVDLPCKVVKVYDGDSLTLAWPRTGPHDPNLCYANSRLYGIDTPELRGTKGRERADAEACRDALRQLALGQRFLLTTVGPTGLDKYGRPLVVLKTCRGLTDDRVINEIRPHATLNDWALKVLPGCQPYFGGTKAAAPASDKAADMDEEV
jgi:endonuclease YncB( thermonuclease family)